MMHGRYAWLMRVIALAVVLFCFGSTLVVAQAPKDVPANHVAAESVSLLIAKGYLPLYDDGTFKGGNYVDRYTLAIALGRLLKDVDAGKVKMSDDDLKLLQKLSTEFREDLVLQGVQLDKLKVDMTSQTAQLEKLKADLAALKGDVAARQASDDKGDAKKTQDMADLAKRISKLTDSMSADGAAQDAQLDKLRTELAALKGDATTRQSLSDRDDAKKTQDIADLAKRITKLTDSVNSDNASQAASLDKVKGELAALKADLAAKQASEAKEDAKSVQETADLTKRLSKLTESVTSMDGKVAALSAKLDKVTSGDESVNALKSRVEALEQETASLKAKAAADSTRFRNMAFFGAAAGVLLSIIVGASNTK